MRTRHSSEKRCPWCQHQLPRKAGALHRCPAKPQTYYPEELRGVSFAPLACARRRRPNQ